MTTSGRIETGGNWAANGRSGFWAVDRDTDRSTTHAGGPAGVGYLLEVDRGRCLEGARRAQREVGAERVEGRGPIRFVGDIIDAQPQAQRLVPDQRDIALDGIEGAVMFSGFDGPSQTRAASSAAAYWVLDDFDNRVAKGQTLDSLIARSCRSWKKMHDVRKTCKKIPQTKPQTRMGF